MCSPSLSIVLLHSILYPGNSYFSFKTHSNILPLGSLSLQLLSLTLATLNCDIPVLSLSPPIGSVSWGFKGESGQWSVSFKYVLSE